jgi:hypothetical protein
MRGRTDRSRSTESDSPDGNFIVDEAFTPDEASKKLCRGLAITLNANLHGKDSVDALSKILRESPGAMPVEFSVQLHKGATAIFRGGKTTVGVTPVLYRRITELLKVPQVMKDDEEIALSEGVESEDEYACVKVLPTAPARKPQSGYRRA